MSSLSSISNQELLAQLSSAVRTERTAAAEVIAHLAELDRRRLYLEQACSSLYSYCTERLGYSEDGALRRVRVARLAQRWPRVLDELASGAIHLTGLFLLSEHLTDDNADALLSDARGKSRRQIQELLARHFPRPDVPERVEAVTALGAARATTWTDPGSSTPPPPRPRLEPLSAASYRMELTISAELYAKIERAKNLLSHAVPNGDLATLVERAIDALLEAENRRRSGAGKPRKRRAQKPGSRHVPVEIEAAVRKRDGDQCTFVDEHGRRCCEKHFLTLEHNIPFALGGPATVDNLRLLCSAHNAYTARQVFGKAHIQNKIADAEQNTEERQPEPGKTHDKVLSALVRMGFRRDPARRALAAIDPGAEPRVEPLLRAALAALTPA